MPEYQMPGADNPEFTQLPPFVRSYIEAMFWTDEERLCEESNGERFMPDVVMTGIDMEARYEGGNSFGFDDLAPEALRSIIDDCTDFKEKAQYLVRNGDWTDEQAGHDFWLTRNDHGTGFWDRGKKAVGERLTLLAKEWTEVTTYVGDDGKVHLA